MLSGAGGGVETSLGGPSFLPPQEPRSLLMVSLSNHAPSVIPAKAGIQSARQGTRGRGAGMGNVMLSGAGERFSSCTRITY